MFGYRDYLTLPRDRLTGLDRVPSTANSRYRNAPKPALLAQQGPKEVMAVAVIDEHPTTYPIGHGDARCTTANQVKDGGACAYHHMYGYVGPPMVLHYLRAARETMASSAVMISWRVIKLHRVTAFGLASCIAVSEPSTCYTTSITL